MSKKPDSPVDEVKRLIRERKIIVSDKPFQSIGVENQVIDYLKEHYVMGLGGKGKIWIPATAIRVMNRVKGNRKILIAKGILATYQHEKGHLDINSAPEDVIEKYRKLAQESELVTEFIKETLSTVSKEFYENQFNQAIEEAHETPGEFTNSPAARWEAMQEIIAGHPEMILAQTHANQIEALRNQFYADLNHK
jgi:hypothetical protein